MSLTRSPSFHFLPSPTSYGSVPFHLGEVSTMITVAPVLLKMVSISPYPGMLGVYNICEYFCKYILLWYLTISSRTPFKGSSFIFFHRVTASFSANSRVFARSSSGSSPGSRLDACRLRVDLRVGSAVGSGVSATLGREIGAGGSGKAELDGVASCGTGAGRGRCYHISCPFP
jgi:hypothetical protein